nr:MAG TPA: hypothetical protein [Microviridae sp.]
MRLWRYQGANALGQRPRPCICRSRYGSVKKSYKNRRKFGKSKKTINLCSVKKTKSINRSIWNIKI